MTPRRSLVAGLAGWTLQAACGLRPAAAQGNDRPLRIVVPQAAGGAADQLARLLAVDLQQRLERPVVIDNRPGGGTIIGTQAVALAPPDGNTIGLVLSALAINQAVRRQMPYHALQDLEPVCLGGYSLVVLVAAPSFPAPNVTQLIELARRSPTSLMYASPGVGSASHLSGELFGVLADVDFDHVPYNGSGPIYAALFAGEIPLAFVTLESALPHLRANRLKALGLTNAQRSTRYPQLPTIGESLPGFEMLGFFGFVAPARTPAREVERLSEALIGSLRASAAHLGDLGVEVIGSPPAAFAAYLRAEIDRYAALARRTGFRLD